MITFDAKTFMDALDMYIALRSKPKPVPESGPERSERELKLRETLMEQLVALESAAKTADRLLLAQVEIAGLVEAANRFIEQKETLPFGALGCVVRALSVLADLGEDEAASEAPMAGDGSEK